MAVKTFEELAGPVAKTVTPGIDTRKVPSFEELAGPGPQAEAFAGPVQKQVANRFAVGGMGGFAPGITQATAPRLKKPNRSRFRDAVDRAASGLAMVGSGLSQLQAGTLTQMPAGPFGPRFTPEQVAEDVKALNKRAEFLWEVSKDPELAAQNVDLPSKALNLAAETIPYITATSIGVLTAGPFGGFAVGGMVEGNNSFRTALDAGVDRDKAKMIGAGVGIVAGAIESFGGRFAGELLERATQKISSKALRTGAVFGVGTLVEALEEGTQEIAAITGEEVYRDVDWKEATNRTLSSMAAGAFLGGTAKVGTTVIQGVSRETGIETDVAREIPPISELVVDQEAPRLEAVPTEKPPQVPIEPEVAPEKAEVEKPVEARTAIPAEPSVEEKAPVQPVAETVRETVRAVPELTETETQLDRIERQLVDVPSKVLDIAKKRRINRHPKPWTISEAEYNVRVFARARHVETQEGDISHEVVVQNALNRGLDVPPIALETLTPEQIEKSESTAPWTMTKNEFELETIKARNVLAQLGEIRDELGEEAGLGKFAATAKSEIFPSETHKTIVERAVRNGKSVPTEVLEDYKSEKWAQDAIAKVTPTPQAKVAKPTEAGAITKAEKDALVEKGFTVPEILKMKPAEARAKLAEKPKAPAKKKAKAAKPVEKPTEAKAKPGKRIISNEAYTAAKKRLTDTGTFRMGVDPRGFVDLITVGAFHFENGLRSFRAWSKKMIEEFGPKVKPQLKGAWNDVRSSVDPDTLQVRQAIKNAKRLTPEVQEKQRTERRRRVGKLAGQLKTSLQKPGSAERAIGRAKGALKGPLTEYQGIYESIRTPDNAEAIDNAFRTIGESPTLSPLTKVSTHEAFTKLVNGDAITLGEASLLEQHFGRSWGKMLRSRIPTADMLWQIFQEAINVPRTTLASGDVSGIGRQARPLGQIHPALFAEMVGKYHKAFWSQKSALALEDATKKMPYYQEAVDDGVLELPEWGLFTAEVIERAERFAGAQIAEKIPGIGIVVRASERSFVTGLNWFRVAVYSQIRTQQEVGGISTTKKERAKIASRINDLSGRSHIKRTKAAKAMQPFLNALFSARFTISRFKPIVTLPLDAARSLRQGKLSTELKMGAGALMSLAATNFLIMYLVQLAGDDDEVQTDYDLRSTDGGKLKLGPTRIDLWSGFLQPAQLMVRLASGERKSAAGTVFEVSRTKILEDFARSKLNPQAGLVVDAYTGETFIGEKILQPPDPEKGPGRILTGIGVPSWVQGVGRGLLWNRMMFLTVQDTADAYMDSGAAMGAVAGLLAWSGTGVTTYLPRASTQLIIEQNKLAQQRYSEKWEDLSAPQQKILSRNTTLRKLEREKKVERNRADLDLSFITEEINKVKKRIRRELPNEIQGKLDELGISISAPSRRLGKLRLSDKRYEFYQSEYIKALKETLPSELRKRNPEKAIEKKANSLKSRIRTRLNSMIRRNEI